MNEQLKKDVCQANIELSTQNLVIYSWGNVSGLDSEKGIVAIKPSGVTYDKLKPENIVLLDLDGNVVEGNLKPSSDTPTHLELYRNFKELRGICHTHSTHATMWAQACQDIPCFGTTHADNFYGRIPVTETMNKQQVNNNYEINTGRVIVDCFKKRNIQPTQMPAVLVAGHGPFTWGDSPGKAVKSAVILEEVAKMSLGTITLNPHSKGIEDYLLDKHYLRKHGKNAYYGQG